MVSLGRDGRQTPGTDFRGRRQRLSLWGNRCQSTGAHEGRRRLRVSLDGGDRPGFRATVATRSQFAISFPSRWTKNVDLRHHDRKICATRASEIVTVCRTLGAWKGTTTYLSVLFLLALTTEALFFALSSFSSWSKAARISAISRCQKLRFYSEA